MTLNEERMRLIAGAAEQQGAKEITYLDVVRAIAAGVLDDQIEQLSRLLSDRSQIVRRMKSMQTNIGDEVKIVNLRPKRFVGYRGKVIRFDGDRAVVALNMQPYDKYDRTVQRYVRNENEISLPLGTFEKIQ